MNMIQKSKCRFKGFFTILEIFIKKMCHPRVSISLKLKEEMVRIESHLLLLEFSTGNGGSFLSGLRISKVFISSYE